MLTVNVNLANLKVKVLINDFSCKFIYYESYKVLQIKFKKTTGIVKLFNKVWIGELGTVGIVGIYGPTDEQLLGFKTILKFI